MTTKQARLARRLHRLVGVIASVFVIFMVGTGLVINHAKDLGLADSHVSQAALLDWYGLEGPRNISSYAVQGSWVSFAGSQVYLDDKAVAMLANGVGAISVEGMLLVAGAEELMLFDRGGNLVERMPWGPASAASIKSIGKLEGGQIAVQTINQTWLSGPELLEWQRVTPPLSDATWAAPEKPPLALTSAITHHYRGSLSLERLLLDLHSGRIFGSIGRLVYDLLAIAIGFLALSGLVLWVRGRQNGK